MNVKRILGSGYFPKELPPPFETSGFANKSPYIYIKWEALLNREKRIKPGESSNDAKKRFRENYTIKYGSSKCVTYSLSKGVYSRRKLGIPNPKQYHDLTRIMVENWKKLRKTYRLTPFSESVPVESDAKRSVRTQSQSLNNFQFKLIEKSFNKRYELKLDISQFYPTIYTHSIAWAIMGKPDAKKYFLLKNKSKANWTILVGTDAKAQLYDFCEELDTLVRNCQERQSVGLPIGPDTSFILAEIIGNRIDNEIYSQIAALDIEGARYYDDYYFYANSYNDAEKVLKISQLVLNEFQLETNENKVKIKKLPFSFEPKWASQLSSYRFKEINQYEIRNFFATIFNVIEDYPTDSSWIISYSLGRFEYGNVKILVKNWDFFLNLLIKTLLIDATIITQFFKIILSYEDYLTKTSKDKIGKILHRIIDEHLCLNHSFEVSWALWILRSLKIKCSSLILTNVLKSEDHVSKLICLDILSSRLYKGRKPSLAFLKNELNSADLWNEKWLFTYESIRKGWLNTSSKIVEEHEYLDILYNYDVHFYNVNNQIRPDFKMSKPRKKLTLLEIKEMLKKIKGKKQTVKSTVSSISSLTDY